MTEKKKTVKTKPVKIDKPEPLTCSKCGCPTIQLYGGKCWTCHMDDEK